MAVVVPVIAVVHRQRRIVEAFRAAGASDAGRAVTAASLGIEEGLAFRQLCGNQVLRDAGGQRWWVDEAEWQRRHAQRHKLALIILAIVLPVILAGILFALTR